MGNYFCLIDQPRLAFVAVAKNGVTYLKKHAIYSRTGLILHDEDCVHDAVGYSADSPYLVPVDQMARYEAEHSSYVKFAVWRDPIERLVSIYKYFCLERVWRIYFNYMGTSFVQQLPIVM